MVEVLGPPCQMQTALALAAAWVVAVQAQVQEQVQAQTLPRSDLLRIVLSLNRLHVIDAPAHSDNLTVDPRHRSIEPGVDMQRTRGHDWLHAAAHRPSHQAVVHRSFHVLGKQCADLCILRMQGLNEPS
jgi:hypothetical protein